MTYENSDNPQCDCGLGAAFQRPELAKVRINGTMALRNTFRRVARVVVKDMSNRQVGTASVPPMQTVGLSLPPGDYKVFWTVDFFDSGPSLGGRPAGVPVRARQTQTVLLSAR